MSYEGFVERLCNNGHYWAVDVHSHTEDDRSICPRCRLPYVWQHSVDQTNGEIEMDDGSIDPDTTGYPLEVDHYEQQLITVPIYKVPPQVEKSTDQQQQDDDH